MCFSQDINFSFMIIIAYFLVLITVPILGAISGYVIAPLFFLKKIIGQSFLLFLSGAVNGFVSIWLGVKILNLFEKEAGWVMILIILLVYIIQYNKGSSGKIKTDDSSLKEIIKKDNNQNTAILIGNIAGLIISCMIFIFSDKLG